MYTKTLSQDVNLALDIVNQFTIKHKFYKGIKEN